MLKLFVKDNFSGTVHEYGTDPHDALILMDDGSLHYEHLQCCVGTMFPEEGFSFCNEDGSIPAWAEDVPYIDIGGEFHKKPHTNADRIRAMSDEELAEFIRDVSYECQDAYCGYHCQMCAYSWCNSKKTLEWLKKPAEGE